MAQTNQNDTFYANNIRVLEFTLTDEDAEAPLDLTGCTVRWALSALLIDGSYDTTPVLRKDSVTAGGIVVENASAGTLRVEIEAADTADLSGRYYHELEVLDAAGDPVVVSTGYLTILANVSNA